MLQTLMSVGGKKFSVCLKMVSLFHAVAKPGMAIYGTIIWC